MIRFAVQDAASELGCEARGAACVFEGVAIDSRKLRAGELFVALPGENVDGHQYVEAAAAKGAAAALVSHWQAVDLPQIRCPDPAIALGQLAGAWRRQCDTRVVGITGSNGKTTVKGMLASIVGETEQVLATEGNFNNEIGLPLTLCRLQPEHRIAILEMGASKPGDISYLSNIAGPQVGLITNAGAAHLQGMGSVEGVARVKGELIEALPADGIAVLNADDDCFELWRKIAGQRTVRTFGLDQAADLGGVYQSRADGCVVQLLTDQGVTEIRLRVGGRHNGANALAAAMTALILGFDLDRISAGLANFEPLAGRLTIQATAAGWTLVEDTYNANPASLKAGLAMLAEHHGERWLVLGDMAELGPDSAALHFQSGAEARRMGVERLYCTGDMSRHAISGFGSNAEFFDSRKALVQRFQADVHDGVICLVKGSRSMQMETVAAAMVAEN